MERKLNTKRVIIAAGIAALVLLVGACIAVFALRGGKKTAEQPLLCEEPAFPETLKAAGGEYTRKLSTYWWVKDVKNGKVIIEDVNRFKGGKEPEDDLGVVDLQGRVMITCDNRDVHFTKNGYISTLHVDKSKNKSTYNFYNMGGNCLATMETVTPEAKEKYEGEGELKPQESAKISDNIDATVTYYGKYAVVSQYEKQDKVKKLNTCIYEFKSAT